MIWHCLTHKLLVGLAAIRGRGVWDGSEARRGRCDRTPGVSRLRGCCGGVFAIGRIAIGNFYRQDFEDVSN